VVAAEDDAERDPPPASAPGPNNGELYELCLGDTLDPLL